MATMVKEKRRVKKKSKEISIENIAVGKPQTLCEGTDMPGSNIQNRTEYSIDIQHVVGSPDHCVNNELSDIEIPVLTEDKSAPEQSSTSENESNERVINVPQMLEIQSPIVCIPHTESSSIDSISYIESITKEQTVVASGVDNVTDDYVYLNEKLKRIAIPDSTEMLSGPRECELSHSDAYLKMSSEIVPQSENVYEQPVEKAAPSAPMFEEESLPQLQYKQEEVIKKVKSKLQCLSLEEAVNLFGGAEMLAVKAMSEREEAIVEAGPVSGPEHPLVDLLSTFSSSLRAVESERSKLASGYADEERSRSTLWKIEKRNIYQKKECKCGTSVELRAVYEHAELLKERMPVARMRLESLLRDVQDSYCHHQHAALLAHCQIEEFISETTQSNKSEIREAFSLILQALRVSEGAAAAVQSAALRRWAAALAAALLDERDARHILFVLHHLFRQSRSVRWAARVLRPRVTDGAAAARTLALLDTLLASPRLDAAVECTEEASAADADEMWEEVSARGGGGAVSEGALREIDLLALLNVFPLRDLVSRIVMFTHADIRQARPYEWGDASGGRGVVRACCGVRALLATLRRAARAHPHYARLGHELRRVAAAALDALSCLYRCPRAPYDEDLAISIAAELQACFTEGFTLFGIQDLHKLTTTLLDEETAKDYCLTFIVGLHDKSPKQIASLSIEAPVLPCDVRVRIITHAAIHREQDHELARIVLDFLFQIGGKVKSTSCKAGCVATARDCLPRLLAAHPYLHTVALHTVADMAQVESLEPSVVSVLGVAAWRPARAALHAVLLDWAARCPLLLPQLLLLLDYTPHTGVSLEVQLLVGSWVCSRARSHPADSEWCWRVLLRTRTHRVWWCEHADASIPDPDPEPTDAISSAYAVLATSWGHCIPLICSSGVSALCAVWRRPREAVHCLAPVMLVMAHSPESVSLTPKFSELFSSLLSCEAGVVARALGRSAAASGRALLLRLALAQLENEPRGGGGRAGVLSAWLHALWRGAGPAGAAVLDAAALAARDWPALDAHAHYLLHEENAKEHVSNAVRNAWSAPLLCECLLRACHAQRELHTGLFAALSNVLWDQRINGQRIHVDNALQKINASVSAEELVIYRAAAAGGAAPPAHPAHLTLWRLFFHLYLQRPTNNMRDTALPVGPLYFSGLIKSRTLAQIRKQLQEVANYHHNEAETYKINNSGESSESTTRVVKSESITIEKGLLPTLTIKDLTGESSGSDSDSEDLSESEEDSKVEERQNDAGEVEKKRIFNMACYHTGAERMIREFCQWIDEGDAVRAAPHHADIARFIPEQALEEAWNNALSRLRPPPDPEVEFPRPAAPPPAPQQQQKTPLDVAVEIIMKIKDRSGLRSRRLLRSPLEDVDFTDTRTLLAVVDTHLNDIQQLAKEWCAEVSRVSALDGALWRHVAALRVPRPLPPVARRCHKRHAACKPILFHIDEREWCISTDAERGIKENRSSSRAATRRLARARPHAARTSAALQSIARRVRDSGAALCVLERAWRAAASCAQCSAAHAALTALVEHIAQRWICHDGAVVTSLVSRWCGARGSALQQALLARVLAPRRVAQAHWPPLYAALLRANLPHHALFSYLSKFEMSHWAQSCEAGQRRAVLAALVPAHSRHGPAPSPEHAILLELLGVHTAALLDGRELCPVLEQLARAAAGGSLPQQQWTHVIKAAEAVAADVSFDQLGHVLRDLGALWWEARYNNKAAALAPHAEPVAKLLRILLRAFVAAAVKLSYEPERVGRCAWSALQESWGAWVAPHAARPLLPARPAEHERYSAMLHSFVGCIQELMCDCPGSEVALLQQAFEWCTVTHMASQASSAEQEARVQATDLLAQLARLPWDKHQWLYGNCLQLATQICANNDVELSTWCVAACGGAAAGTLLRDVTPATLAPRLAALLYLFTGTPATHHQQVLEEACRLPWAALPEAALGDALDRFFAVHHNPLQAYHELPHFQVLLFASELSAGLSGAGAHSRDKRARAVSQWVRACAAPALHAHVPHATRFLLHTLNELAPHIEESAGEMEELLGRASAIMCMEPAAAAALPAWQEWVGGASARAAAACASAASALTAAAYCAALSNAALAAHMAHDESCWDELVGRWSSSSPWRSPHAFVSRACLHAGYVCALANAHAPHACDTLAALHAASIDFIENEAIVAVWICYVCRLARSCSTIDTREAEECGQAARALLSAWAQPARRSILRVVTLQADPDRTTVQHRLLCRLAECVLCPSAEAAQAYEAACSSLRTNADVTHWGKAPCPKHLPRLAVRLYPKYERYFRTELDAAPDT